jgi:hypothetical protein
MLVLAGGPAARLTEDLGATVNSNTLLRRRRPEQPRSNAARPSRVISGVEADHDGSSSMPLGPAGPSFDPPFRRTDRRPPTDHRRRPGLRQRRPDHHPHAVLGRHLPTLAEWDSVLAESGWQPIGARPIDLHAFSLIYHLRRENSTNW